MPNLVFPPLPETLSPLAVRRHVALRKFFSIWHETSSALLEHAFLAENATEDAVTDGNWRVIIGISENMLHLLQSSLNRAKAIE